MKNNLSNDATTKVNTQIMLIFYGTEVFVAKMVTVMLDLSDALEDTMKQMQNIKLA